MTRLLFPSAPILFFIFVLISGCRSQDWSPQDADLVFVSDRTGNAEIYLLSAGDTAWVNLTNHIAGDNGPTWSPDGTKLAFHSNRNGALDVWVMQADGSHLRLLTDDPDHDYLPSWTPDGRILFTSWRVEEGDAERAPRLYIVDVDGGNEHRLSLESGLPASNGRFSPDGTQLAFSRSENAAPSNIWIALADGSAERQLTSSDTQDTDPVFSPDGKWIAYHADRRSSSAIRVVSVEGTGDRAVLEDALHYHPRWSDDGDWLIACSAGSDENYDVVAFRPEGGSPPITLVGGVSRACEGSWRPQRQPG